mmetsp:Transcript_41460/g.97351  ORF Transcript_41460/g.97351 Transcript_41460/m.97351 type:complete len:214 (+) Transcript_41460:1504-2145(+)
MAVSACCCCCSCCFSGACAKSFACGVAPATLRDLGGSCAASALRWLHGRDELCASSCAALLLPVAAVFNLGTLLGDAFSALGRGANFSRLADRDLTGFGFATLRCCCGCGCDCCRELLRGCGMTRGEELRDEGCATSLLGLLPRLLISGRRGLELEHFCSGSLFPSLRIAWNRDWTALTLLSALGTLGSGGGTSLECLLSMALPALRALVLAV